MNRFTLVLGGARSGKSRYAEGQAGHHRGRCCYIATAEAFDDEMSERIARHRRDRGKHWETIEAPLDLATAVAGAAGSFILVDCITVWLANLLHHGRDPAIEVERLCTVIKGLPARVVVVSNEVGQGIVPENALARRFRDEQGLVNQRLAALADDVILVTAGIAQVLKSQRRKRKSPPQAKSRLGRRA